MNPHLIVGLRITLLMVVAILIQTTLGDDLRVAGVAPDLMVLLAICAGLTGGAESGALVGFWAGLITDLTLTATPFGLSALTYCLIGAAVGALRTGLLPEARLVVPAAALFGTAAAVVLWVGLGDMLGQSQLLDSGRSWLIKVALVEAGWATLLALPVGWLYARAARGSKGAGTGRHDTERHDAAGKDPGSMNAPEPASPQLRLTILLVVVACLFVALFARLWFLQVMNAPKAQAAAENNGVRLIYADAPRGLIEDRNGNVLVGNVNEPVIQVSRLVADQNPSMVSRLAPLLGMTVPQLKKAINNLQYSPYAPVPVMPDASAQQILYIQENQELFPGVQATTMSVRTYSPMGKAAANLVGYVGQINQSQYQRLKGQGYQPGDQIGLAGVEAEYEGILRGTPGVSKLQVDSRGNVLTTLSTTRPVAGDNVRLTLDGQIQMLAEVSLQQGMNAARNTFDRTTGRNFTAPAGSAVVEDPRNGQILALATNPTYDPAQFVGGISKANYQALLNNPTDPLLDRTIQGQYAPGSTFKLITATAGLQYGLITPSTPFDDTGSITIGNFVAHNDNGAAYGIITLPTAITVSSDNFFNTIGLNLWYGRGQFGDDALQTVAKEYGLGVPTGIALPNEAAGKIPTPESYVKDHLANPNVFTQSQWYPGNSDQVAIGQDEVLVTPLQLANAYATFANGGNLLVPQMVLDAENPVSKHVDRTYPVKVVHHVTLQPEWRAAMLQGFTGVVNNPTGTAYGDFKNTPVAAMDIAGKTGTAQVNAPRQATSVFTSFAPATNPRFVVDAFIEDAGYGASVAAPVVREIYDGLFNFPLQPVTYAGAGSGGQN